MSTTDGPQVDLPDSAWSWNAHAGFTVEWDRIAELSDSVDVVCTAELGYARKQLKFSVTFMDEVRKLSPPTIDSRWAAHVPANATFQLNCSTFHDVEIDVELHWIRTGSEVQTCRLFFSFSIPLRCN